MRLPTAMKLPPSIPTQAVRLDHAAAGATSVRAHVVTIGAAMPHGITCDVVTLGKLELVFTRSAGLGNPERSRQVRDRRAAQLNELSGDADDRVLTARSAARPDGVVVAVTVLLAWRPELAVA